MKFEKLKLSELKSQLVKVEVNKMKKITGGGIEKGRIFACYLGSCTTSITDSCEGCAVCTDGLSTEKK